MSNILAATFKMAALNKSVAIVNAASSSICLSIYPILSADYIWSDLSVSANSRIFLSIWRWRFLTRSLISVTLNCGFHSSVLVSTDLWANLGPNVASLSLSLSSSQVSSHWRRLLEAYKFAVVPSCWWFLRLQINELHSKSFRDSSLWFNQSERKKSSNRLLREREQRHD